MVVNRKQPAAPVPLVQSRSTSQQPIVMRKKQAKFISSNGINSHKPEDEPSTNPDFKEESTSQPQPQKKSLRNRLFFWSLSFFTLYSFLICSPYTTTPQKAHSHLICRAETNYKTYILEPFILPPLKHTFSYTHSLAKPYISQANIHLEPYIAPVKQVTSTVKPYVVQTATTTKRVWKDTLTPLYKNTLKPYYQSTIAPRYDLYLRPYLLPLVAHLERYCAYYISNPIRIQCNRVQLYFSTLYSTHIHSYISHLQPYIHRFTLTVRTTCLFSIDFYDTHIRPTLLSTWIQVRPHLSFAFDQGKDISLNAVAGTAKQLRRLAKQLGTQRRTYVDPHIRKIWDKVEENATAKTTTAPPDISFEEETAESTIIASPVIHQATSITNTQELDTPTDVPVPDEDAQDTLHPAESTPPLPTSLSPPRSASTQEVLQSAVSIAEASAYGASTAVYELDREVEALVDGKTADTTMSGTPQNLQTEVVQAEAEGQPKKEETPNEPTISTPALEEWLAESTVEAPLGGATNPTPGTDKGAAGVIGVGASSPSPSVTTGEVDLDDFLRDIGLDTTSTSSPSPAPTQPTEADQAASIASAQEAETSRLATIAAKRLAITTRHAALESDLQSSILAATSQVIEKLNEMRKDKKEELIGMIEGNEGEGLVVGLTLTADKLMKGLEVYSKKCEERSGAWKHGVGDKGKDEEDIQKRTGLAKDEQTRFESVVEKIEIKFLDVVQKLQEQVNGWYLGAIEKEQAEISKIKTEIKNMAEQAQADLGMDYAWLEDVTYMDWQKYHDLMRAFEDFAQTAYAVQSGTSLDPPSPPNPIKPVIDALQEELQTVVLGFHVALGSMRNTISELFSIHEPISVDDGVGAGVGDEGKLRIQPIDPDADEKEETGQNEEGFDASKVIIGKSKEQIEQALGDVPLVVTHEEL
ncbi:hypothetical protein BYT27DRAFT_7198437 [Phlegmacium glaucopus]|nr:hypothetical protein BYT27DRAFT_7198437 [Phlegmacium glaucopus]